MAERWSFDTAVTALARLSGVGPVRLDRLLGLGDPVDVVLMLRGGHRPAGLGAVKEAGTWADELRATNPAALAAELAAADIVVSVEGSPDHPPRLSDDIDPAPVLFRRGRPFDPGSAGVAIVGTRRCSGTGREIARELGYGLSRAGVSVVSGLALGIDGAAHAGAVAAGGAPPVAFVGGGPDVVYPPRAGDLWGDVIRTGTLASEAPPGAAPSRWRFPARNRLIAAMADLVVVVESRAAGGSLLTVDEAVRRDRQVMAVPGSVRNPAAVGTNELLAAGCAPVCDVDDVLVALGLGPGVASTTGADAVSPPVPAHLAEVHGAIDDGPTSVDQLVARVERPVLEIVTHLAELVAGGWVVDDGARVRRA